MSMKDFCILWNRDGTSDKLWGITEAQGETVTFWGRRGKVLSFKHVSVGEAMKLRDKKLNNGYRTTTFATIEANTPDFRDMMDEQLVICVLSDGFHGERYQHKMQEDR